MNKIPGLEGRISEIAEKVFNSIRLSPEEGLYLYTDADLQVLSLLASARKRMVSGDKVFFNHNFHIEPTNICLYNCTFCSYHKKPGEEGSWEFSIAQMLDIVRSFDGKPVTEVHIVGGVHPDYDIHYWCGLLNKIRAHRPDLHIKAFSAIELDYMIQRAGLSFADGFKLLKENGLQSIPGGGAEIFDETIRREICGDKSSSDLWLKVHEEAHMAGIQSNATILYGHIENYEHRIDHMDRLRKLQDRTGGFNAFIPLKFRKQNNLLEYAGEVSLIEDLRNFAVSRLFLENIPHLKAYWPAIGREAAQLSMLFGVDDLDGTIDDTTKIYSMAGAEEEKPAMTTTDLIALIKGAGYTAWERDSLYNPIKEWR